MLSKPKLVSKLVRLMTDPIPEFVSLVSNAANQTPFRVVKAEDVVLDGTETTRPEGPHNNSQYMVAKMEFNKERFTDSKAVKKYLDDLGYTRTEYDIVEEVNLFSANSRVFNSNDKNIVMIEGNVPGVSIYVGKTDSGLEEINKSINQEDSTIVKNKTLLINGETPEQLVEKFDSWSASWSNEKDIMQAIEDGMGDGLPPGATEVFSAFWAAVSNSLKENDEASVRKACADLGELFVKLNNVFSTGVQRGVGSHDELVEKTFLRSGLTHTESSVTKQEGEVALDNKSEGETNAAEELPTVQDATQQQAVEKTEDEQPAGESAAQEPPSEVNEQPTEALEGVDSEAATTETPVDVEKENSNEVASEEQQANQMDTLSLENIKLMMIEVTETRFKELETAIQDTAQKVEKLNGSAVERRSLDADEVSSVSKTNSTQLPDKQTRTERSMSDVFMRGALGF